jgi:putative flippase GtrA
MLLTFSRYLAVQLLAYGIDFGGFLVLTHALGMSPLPANVAGKLAAGAFAFVAHRHLTFRESTGAGAKGQLLRYVLLLALNVPLSSGVLALLLLAGPSPSLAKILADAICIGLTFYLSRNHVFTPSGKRDDGDA